MCPCGGEDLEKLLVETVLPQLKILHGDRSPPVRKVMVQVISDWFRTLPAVPLAAVQALLLPLLLSGVSDQVKISSKHHPWRAV